MSQRSHLVIADALSVGVKANLTAGISATDASFTLESGTGFGTSDFDVVIENEIITVGSRSGAVCSSLTRGVAGTMAAPHNRGDSVAEIVNADTVSAAVEGGGSQPITRAQYDLALTGVAQNTPTKLPFAFNYGTELLDLSDTTEPTPVESGTYSFAVTITISGIAAGAGWSVVVTLDEDDFAATMSAFSRIPGTSGAQAVPFPFYVPAGSPCNVKVTHDANDVGGADFSGHVYVQRLS